MSYIGHVSFRPMLVTLLSAAVGFGAYGTVVESRFTWFYAPLTVVYALVVGGLDRRFRFSRPLLWALTGAAIGNLLGGVLLVGGDQLYSVEIIGSVAFDDIQHAAAAGIVAVACWAMLKTRHGVGSAPRIVPAVLMAAGLGTIVEMVEFVGATLWETNVGGYPDSMIDLVSNLAGASIAGVLIRLRSDPA